MSYGVPVNQGDIGCKSTMAQVQERTCSVEKERDTPQVEMVINQLRQTAEMLEEAVGRLEDRLRPVLANLNPMLQEAKAATKGPELVELASMIESQQIRLAVIFSRLVGMLQRLEI